MKGAPRPPVLSRSLQRRDPAARPRPLLQPRRRGGVSRDEPAPFIQEVKATSGSMKTNGEPGGVGRKAGEEEGTPGRGREQPCGGRASRRRVAVVILSPPPPRLARGCLSPRLAAPELHAAAAARASKGRHVPAARARAQGGSVPAGLPGECRGGPGGAAQAPRLPSTAAGARPGGCAAPGSEAWRGFCTSGPTISQVRGLGYPAGEWVLAGRGGGLRRVFFGEAAEKEGQGPFRLLGLQ